MSSLRSILGGSRVTKKKKTSQPASSSLSSWPRTKPAGPARSKSLPDSSSSTSRLPRHGPAPLSAPIQTVAQALHHAQATMFDPLPPSLPSVQTAATLTHRAALPAVVSVAHVSALLGTQSPSAAERAVAAAVRAGAVRRFVVPTRGGIGDVLADARGYEAAVARRCAPSSPEEGEGGILDPATRDAFVAFLRRSPSALRMDDDDNDGLAPAQTDRLIRAGFLTAHNELAWGGGGGGAGARPEDRYTLMSVEAVSRAASGSYGAVGGADVVASAGASGAGRAAAGGGGAGGEGLRLAVPGTGPLLKLVAAALAQLAALLEGQRYREMPQSVLKERWDGGVLTGAAAAARRARGEFAGVLPGRTKKWREFYGLSFEWVLAEAVGVGLVEVFDTRSVGNGVRLIS